MYNARIFIVFFIAAIVGTLAHECGHVIAGSFVGFETAISYAYTNCYNCKELSDAADALGKLRDYESKQMLFTLGGPLQTMLTGTIGIVCLLLVKRRTVIDSHKFNHLLWLALAFFWSRAVFNEVLLWGNYFINNEWSGRGDETKLFAYFNISQIYGHLMLFCISAAILLWIAFGILQQHRKQFIVWGAIGSLCGGVLWMYGVGKYIMP